MRQQTRMTCLLIKIDGNWYRIPSSWDVMRIDQSLWIRIAPALLACHRRRVILRGIYADVSLRSDERTA